MQEKPFYVHVELHKEIVKNAWIISHEGRKILVIEFQDTVTEDESIAYVFALAKSLVSEKNTKEHKRIKPGSNADGKRNLRPHSGRRNAGTY